MKIRTNPPVRGTDLQGSGAYGASRGTRVHRGVDFACIPGTGVCAGVAGKITKLGKPYADDPDTKDINEFEMFDYVQVTDAEGLNHRFFYVEPCVSVGDTVNEDTVIGHTQKLHYGGITQHFHYEVKKGKKFLNPLLQIEGE